MKVHLPFDEDYVHFMKLYPPKRYVEKWEETFQEFIGNAYLIALNQRDNLNQSRLEMVYPDICDKVKEKLYE